MKDRSESGKGAVPAADRTLAALEHLARLPDGGTLSQLSRSLATSPSSLLALLT
ncbi:MAG: helix-turn-helix domain-containing protein, partial [Deltaproteobacteria bacterium]|nr:helix-turn-helix domain-containing protein [Deltaproteobacteria bacterium]